MRATKNTNIMQFLQPSIYRGQAKTQIDLTSNPFGIHISISRINKYDYLNDSS